eukprot:m.69464 g.69464  ORF g.69464 m.69464 type:complete len:435 (+) comp14129_c0_seq1:121-1425(+)
MDVLAQAQAQAALAIITHSYKPTSTKTTPAHANAIALKQGHKYTTWKRRYLVLDQSSLRYYKNDKASTPQGIISLSPFVHAYAAEIGDVKATNATSTVKLKQGRVVLSRVDRNFGIALLVPSQDRTYYFHFESAALRRVWLDCLHTNLELLRRQAGVLETMVSALTHLKPTAYPKYRLGRLKMALRNRYRARFTLKETDPFHLCLLACLTNDATTLRACLQLPLLDQPSSSGTTLLMKAASADAEDCVRFLLEEGAAVDSSDMIGDTALLIAARCENAAVARLLCQAGADVNHCNHHRETAQTEAVWLGATAVVNVLGATSSESTVQTTSLQGKAVQDLDMAVQMHALGVKHCTKQQLSAMTEVQNTDLKIAQDNLDKIAETITSSGLLAPLQSPLIARLSKRDAESSGQETLASLEEHEFEQARRRYTLSFKD